MQANTLGAPGMTSLLALGARPTLFTVPKGRSRLPDLRCAHRMDGLANPPTLQHDRNDLGPQFYVKHVRPEDKGLNHDLGVTLRKAAQPLINLAGGWRLPPLIGGANAER